MDLTLDYNIELYPLKNGESFSLVLASSLARGRETGTANGTDGAEEDKEAHTWRPDGKGRGGLEDDYEYVMYGKVRLPVLFVWRCFWRFYQVYKFDGGASSEIV